MSFRHCAYTLKYTMITKSDVNNIASTFFHESARDRANQCSRMTTIMKTELEDMGVQCERVLGSISYIGEGTGHAYIKVPASEFKDITNGPVIIDVSIHQFNSTNSSDSSIDVSIDLEQDFTLPSENEVGIYTPQDSIYSIYNQ